MSTTTRDLALRELGPMRPAGSYTFDEMYRFAQMCHQSGMFDDVKDASQAMVKIVKGQEMGLPPTTAMSAFDIIQKKLFIKPWAIAALINSCGYGSYRVVEQTSQQCTVAFRRKYAGEGWVDLEPETYTIDEAKDHGLVQRSPHWKASPAHMLYQRAMGRGGAKHFPELLAGLQPPQEETVLTSTHRDEAIEALYGAPTDPTLPLRRETPAADATQAAPNVSGATHATQDASGAVQAPEGPLGDPGAPKSGIATARVAAPPPGTTPRGPQEPRQGTRTPRHDPDDAPPPQGAGPLQGPPPPDLSGPDLFKDEGA